MKRERARRMGRTAIAWILSVLSLVAGVAPGFLALESAVAQPGPCVAVTEIMVNPEAAPDATGEWFEITNHSVDIVYDLQGWTFSDSAGAQTFTIEEQHFLAPQTFVVLARSGDAAANGGIVPDFVYSNLRLNNSGDTIAIRTSDETLVDLVGYTVDMVEPGAALACEIGHALLNDSPARWYSATTVYGAGDRGTPGAPNETYEPGPCTTEVGIADTPSPARPVVLPPAPNPGRPPFELAINLPSPTHVRLSIHNVQGRTIRLLEDAMLERGHHRLGWDGTDSKGERVARGIYWMRVRAGEETAALPITLLR